MPAQRRKIRIDGDTGITAEFRRGTMNRQPKKEKGAVADTKNLQQPSFIFPIFSRENTILQKCSKPVEHKARRLGFRRLF
ncbi:MAG: hypothetical protein IJL26_10950, partial [Clostridia bacterium]|nr:hypothetical protein [Clostridia bacterium]